MDMNKNDNCIMEFDVYVLIFHVCPLRVLCRRVNDDVCMSCFDVLCEFYVVWWRSAEQMWGSHSCCTNRLDPLELIPCIA